MKHTLNQMKVTTATRLEYFHLTWTENGHTTKAWCSNAAVDKIMARNVTVKFLAGPFDLAYVDYRRKHDGYKMPILES